MLKWLKDRADKKAEERTRRLAEQQQRAQAVVDAYQEAMLEHPCPFNSMENCTEYCVHFSHGYVTPVPTLKGDVFYFRVVEPHCKLWK